MWRDPAKGDDFLRQLVASNHRPTMNNWLEILFFSFSTIKHLSSPSCAQRTVLRQSSSLGFSDDCVLFFSNPNKNQKQEISTTSSLNSCLQNQNPNRHNSGNSTKKFGNNVNVDSDNRDDDNSERSPPCSGTTCWVRNGKIRSSITRTKDQSHMRKT